MKRISFLHRHKHAARFVVWLLTGLAVTVPVLLAALSPLQHSREWEYVSGALAGVVALSALFVQPLLAARWLPGLSVVRANNWHRWLGYVIVLGVAWHIIGLYLASPADMLDALMLVAPTPFSLYGVIGLWAVVFTILLVLLRARMRRRNTLWAWLHNLLALVVVVASVVHAVMITGTMNTVSKVLLCASLVGVTVASLVYVRAIKPHRASKAR